MIAATLTSLARDGHAGISVRRIAAEAGVSVGLLNHHFGSIDALIAETYHKLASELTTALWQEVDQAVGPAARLDAFLAGSFSSRLVFLAGHGPETVGRLGGVLEPDPPLEPRE
nr:TetR family transcriptional regulator [Pseudomonas sp. K5002]